MFKKLTLAIFIFSFVGCSLIQRREQRQQSRPLPIPKTGELPPTIELPKQNETVQPPPTPDTKVPQIGIIFGPGGARAYSYIGVLREFEKARIPIAAVAGVEWGSMMAALYAMNGKVNDVEWQGMKIPNDFAEKSFLSSRPEPRSFTDVEKYLRNFFGGKKIETGKIPFSCVTENIRNSRNLMIFRGTYRDTVALCLDFPPLLSSNNGWVAAPFDLKYLIDQMTQRGIDYIILVDVLTSSAPLAGTRANEETILVWSQLTKVINLDKSYVHQVIQIPIQKSILDFSSRREFIQTGEQAGQQAVQQLSQKFRF